VVVPDNGQRDYGVRLAATETTYIPCTQKWDFIDGSWGDIWTLEKSNVCWETVLVNSATNTFALQCTATEPLQTFPAPQYSLSRFGVALWGNVQTKDISEIRASMTTLDGQINMGLALRMQDALNGYFCLLSIEETVPYVSLYKSSNGMVSLITKTPFANEFTNNTSYELFAKVSQNNIQFYVDNVLYIDHFLEPLDIVSVDGDFGIVIVATSTVQCNWIETVGNMRNVITPTVGLVTTAQLTVSDLAQWTSIEIDSSILQGSIAIEYSIDSGNTFLPVPFANINYPSPITKRFDISNIPITLNAPNTIIFMATMYDIGSTGWIRSIKVTYLTTSSLPYELNDIVVAGNKFQLADNAYIGTLTTKHSFLPSQIYSWDTIVADQYQATILDSITNLYPLISAVTVDSYQESYIGDLIIDNSLDTYWESKRGADSWIIFDFMNPVEVHSFRWVKKSATDAATFYSFQVFDEESNQFVIVDTFGYEVNADITHTLTTPVKGSKFRIFINCVQPMSFGNARLIEIFGKSVVSSSTIQYQYSLDDGNTYHNVVNYDLSALPVDRSIKFRCVLSRSRLDAVLSLQRASFRFVGRDKSAKQVTDLQYDLNIGDQFIYNLTPFHAHEISCITGNTLQLKIRFIIHPEHRFDGIKPWLSGYKLGITCSQYQSQIDALQAQINSVIWQADRDPNKDTLIDAIMCLIAQGIESLNANETDVDKIILRLMSHLNIEISKNRSRIVLGDVGHLDEALPSELFNAKILL
jgi:hypothetical protein